MLILITNEEYFAILNSFCTRFSIYELLLFFMKFHPQQGIVPYFVYASIKSAYHAIQSSFSWNGNEGKLWKTLHAFIFLHIRYQSSS